VFVLKKLKLLVVNPIPFSRSYKFYYKHFQKKVFPEMCLKKVTNVSIKGLITPFLITLDPRKRYEKTGRNPVKKG